MENGPDLSEYVKPTSEETLVVELGRKALMEIARKNEYQRRIETDRYIEYQNEYNKNGIKEEVEKDFKSALGEGTQKFREIIGKYDKDENRQFTKEKIKTLAYLTIHGVKNPHAVLKILESDTVRMGALEPIRAEQIPNQRDKTGMTVDYVRQRAYGAIIEVYERARNEQFIKRCKEIGDVPTAIERGHKLGMKVNADWLRGDKAEQITKMYVKLARVNKDSFDHVSEEILKHEYFKPFVSANPEGNTEVQVLVDYVCSRKLVTEEEKQAFATADRLDEIYSCSSWKRGVYKHDLLKSTDPEMITREKNRLEDEKVVLEELILELYNQNPFVVSPAEKHHEQQRVTSEGSQVPEKLNSLVESGTLKVLADLIRSGATIGERDNFWIATSYPSEENYKNSLEFPKKVKEFKDFLDSLSGDQIGNILKIDEVVNDASANLHLVIERIAAYRYGVENSDFVMAEVKAGDRIAQLKGVDEKDARGILKDLMESDPDRGIIFKSRSLLMMAQSPEVRAKMTVEEQKFWEQLTLLEGDDQIKPSEEILSFLIGNTDKIEKYCIGGKFTDAFFDDFYKFFDKVPEEYYTKRHELKKYSYGAINRFVFEKNHIPPKMDFFAKMLGDNSAIEVNEILDKLGADITKLEILCPDGNPSFEFVNYLISSGFRDSISGHFLSELMIANAPESEKGYLKLLKKLGPWNDHFLRFVTKNKETNPDFFVNGEVSPAAVKAYFATSFEGNNPLYLTLMDQLENQGLLGGFDVKDKIAWKFMATGDSTFEQRKVLFGKMDEMYQHFDADGKPFSSLMTFCSKYGSSDQLRVILETNEVANFSPMEISFWNKWKELPIQGRNQYRLKLAKEGRVGEKWEKELDKFVVLYDQIMASNSLELQKISEQLIPLLIDSSDAEADLKKIKAIFEKNNLPSVGKKFRIFEILYLTPNGDGKSRFDNEMSAKGRNLSPVLREAGKQRVINTLYRDLLKIDIDSADPDLKSYLSSIVESQKIIDKVKTEGIESLSIFEIRRVDAYLNKMGVLYDSSKRGRLTGGLTNLDKNNIEARIKQLESEMGVTDGQKISERVARMFAGPLGFASVEQVLERMKAVKQNADTRNRHLDGLEEGRIIIHENDLLKGVDTEVMDYVLQSGVVAREFIGVMAGSDQTPFDTDTGRVLKTDLEGGFLHIVDSSPATEYGGIILLIKDRGQFQRTYTEKDKETMQVDVKYDYDKYELFNSGIVNERHFGVRTGVPATEIDAIIVRSNFQNDEKLKLKNEELFFKIANNGFYIPVADREGKVIFTEQDYEKYKIKSNLVKEALVDKNYSPEELISALSKATFVEKLYEMDSGASGYKTGEHTGTVMNRFEKYYGENYQSDLLSLSEARLMFALHDIGKPLAVAYTSSTEMQHIYTRKLLNFMLQSAEVDPRKADVITAFVDQDILGDFFKEVTAAENSEKAADFAAEKVIALADTLGIEREEALKNLQMFFACDAGAYTADAGVKDELDFLFDVEKSNPTSGVALSAKYDTAFKMLRNKVLNYKV